MKAVVPSATLASNGSIASMPPSTSTKIVTTTSAAELLEHGETLVVLVPRLGAQRLDERFDLHHVGGLDKEQARLSEV